MNKKKTYITILTLLSIIGGLFVSLLYKEPNKTVNIVYFSDKNYIPYMMTSLYSATKNKHKESIYNIYIIAKDFNQEDKNKLNNIKLDNVKINIVSAKEKTLDYTRLGRFSGFKTAMQKIFISDYLQNLDKVLYLDADTIVQKDLLEVYNKDVSQNYLAATKDGLMYQFPEHITEIGLDWRKFYFNSGVMLLNLDKIRKDNLLTEAINYFNTHEEVFGDQDILNVIVKDKVLSLSYLYNCNSTFFEERDAKFLSQFYEEPVSQTPRKVYDNATILHFAGHKPWTPWFTHSYLKPLWQEYHKEMNTIYKITP